MTKLISSGVEEMQARRVCIIFNPFAGGGKRQKLGAIIKQLRGLNCEVTVQETESAGHASRLAAAASVHDFDIVVAAGGDGTISEVAHGLRASKLPLGLIPLGTANVLANELGLAKDETLVSRTIAEAPFEQISVGLLNGQRFIMMAGAGFDAHVVTRVSSKLKGLVGKFAFYWETCVQAFRYRPSGCFVDIDGTSFQANSIFVCNGKYFGGPHTAAPEGDLKDNRLFAILFQGKGWFNVLRYSGALLLGNLAKLHDVKILPAHTIRIRGNEPEPCQVDGEFVARLPVEISVDREPLKIAWPAASV